ncbi:hypothetical protein [Streptomyces sp. NPDC007883]|uniref:MmyB family transcriptional regulator n=1 Tax=Streptomyces sp. NPDC007883 TaxID=3155116 RepID=UPI0033D805FF
MPLRAHEQWRASAVDLEETARTMTAKFRAPTAGHPAGPAGKVPLKRPQSVSSEFREVWDRCEVGRAEQAQADPQRPRRPADARRHGSVARSGQRPRMVTYVPVDEE